MRTDSEGRFEMRGLPEGGGNLFPMDHPSDGPWAYRAIDNLALHPGKTSEVTIELIEGVLVEGKVAEATTGKPIVGVGVGMYGPARPRSGAAILSATTNDQGKYQFRLPAGETYFYIYSSDSELGGVAVCGDTYGRQDLYCADDRGANACRQGPAGNGTQGSAGPARTTRWRRLLCLDSLAMFRTGQPAGR